MDELLKKYNFIDYIVLFGSRARGDNAESSDYNISVIFSNDYERYPYIDALLEVATDLSHLFRTDKVDCSCFNRSSVLLRHNVIADGKILFQAKNPSQNYAYLVYITNREFFDYADFQMKNIKEYYRNYKSK